MQTLPEAPKVVTLMPAAIARFETMLANLHEAMRSGNVHAGSEDAAFIRELVTSITVRKGAKRAELEIEIAGHLNALLSDECLSRSTGENGGSGGAFCSLPPTADPFCSESRSIMLYAKCRFVAGRETNIITSTPS